MAVRKLVVEVVEARNLLPKDGTSTSSPYARADFDGQRRETRTVVRDLNPAWNEALEFSFPPSGVDPVAGGQPLEVAVFHDVRVGPSRRSNFLGRVRLDARQFVRKGEEALIYFPLESETKSSFSWVRGDIGLKVYYVDEPLSPPLPEPEPPAAGDAAPPADAPVAASADEPPKTEEPADAAPAPPVMTVEAVAASEEKTPAAEEEPPPTHPDEPMGRSMHDIVDKMPCLSARVARARELFAHGCRSAGTGEAGRDASFGWRCTTLDMSAWDLPPDATVPVSGLDGKGCADAYKYGPKWASTRTVAESFDPARNEQYAWPVYDPCSVLAVDVFDDPPSSDAISSVHDVGLGQGEPPRASVRSASASNLRFGRGHVPFISSSGSSSSIYHSAEGSPSVGSSILPSYSYSQGHRGSPPFGPSGSPPPPPPPPCLNEAERSSALDMSLIAYGATATVGIFAEIKELRGRWGTAPKLAFGVTTAMAISSMGLGLMTAVPRLVPFSRRRKFSAFCARLSTVLSTALLIISTFCVTVVPNGWMIGVPVAAVVATVMIALCVFEERSAEEGVSNFWARQKPASDTELGSIHSAC